MSYHNWFKSLVAKYEPNNPSWDVNSKHLFGIRTLLQTNIDVNMLKNMLNDNDLQIVHFVYDICNEFYQ